VRSLTEKYANFRDFNRFPVKKFQKIEIWGQLWIWGQFENLGTALRPALNTKNVAQKPFLEVKSELSLFRFSPTFVSTFTTVSFDFNLN
jgi:hypothetical protein